MSGILIRIALAGIGAAVAAFIAYRAANNNNIYKTNNRLEATPQRTATAVCSVCLNDFSNFSKRINLPCGHRLHTECAEILFVQRENSCPLCRRKISPEFLRAHFPEM